MAAPISPQDVLRIANEVESARSADDEPIFSDASSALFVVPVASAKCSLYRTKTRGPFGFNESTLVNAGYESLSLYGIPGPAHVAAIARACSTPRLRFVGDLDPLDLTIFLLLELELSAVGIHVEHVGVGKRWLQACRASIRAGSRKLPVIEMSSLERFHWSKLRDVRDWSSVLGADGMQLLEGGEKLELEGAMNDAFYQPHLTERLVNDILTD